MKKQGRAGRVRGLGLVLVVLAGVLSNLATTVDAGCDANAPRSFEFSGDGQTGAATAPLGAALAVTVTCANSSGGGSLGDEGETVQWTVLSGGGLVDGRNTLAKITWYDGRAAVNWQLGPDIGEQTVSARVRDRLVTFKATAGGATSGGTCTGGAGTDFDARSTRTIEGDETWPLAGSPYRGGSVVVGSGATLTIVPGVTTCLGNLAVHGNGQLRAEGTPTLPVEMAPAAINGAWSADFLRFVGPNPDGRRHSALRHVNARALASLRVAEAALQIEDSTLTASTAAGQCPGVRWELPLLAPAADSAVRRTVFDGFGGGIGCVGNGGNAGVDIAAPTALAAEPMPFQARVLRSPGDGVRLAGAATAAVALTNCEISGSGRDGLVVEHSGLAAPAAVVGCNFTTNARFALRNAQALATTVDARGNWWGDATGAPTAGGNAVSIGVNAGGPAAAPFVLGY